MCKAHNSFPCYKLTCIPPQQSNGARLEVCTWSHVCASMYVVGAYSLPQSFWDILSHWYGFCQAGWIQRFSVFVSIVLDYMYLIPGLISHVTICFVVVVVIMIVCFLNSARKKVECGIGWVGSGRCGQNLGGKITIRSVLIWGSINPESLKSCLFFLEVRPSICCLNLVLTGLVIHPPVNTGSQDSTLNNY